MSTTKILIAGATGYIGGTVLAALINDNAGSKYSFSALIRHENQAGTFTKLGVKTIPFKGLDDEEANKKAAAEHDIVINAASSSHCGSVKAWIQGLSERQKQTGTTVFFIQTGGTSILGDRPITKGFVDTSIHSDQDDIFSYEKKREETEHYSQRAADLEVVKSGEEYGVKTYITIAPTIYGTGTGQFNTTSIQLPWLIRHSLTLHHAIVIGSGSAIWNHVHVLDLASIYVLLISQVLSPESTNAGKEVPYGRKGIYFAETGEHTWLQASQAIAAAMKEQGLASTDEVQSMGLKDAAGVFMGGHEDMAELNWASNARARGDKTREVLGWNPKRGDDDFYASFGEEVRRVSEEKSAPTALLFHRK